MKRLYTLYICLGMLLLAALPMQAASEAEYGKLKKTYTLHPDGSQEMRVYKELTLFTHTAMNSLYGESFIVYNPAYQELKIHESYTRQKNGNMVLTPENAFVECLPRAAAGAPAYNGLKEMVVVHTGLELGATICLDYSIITRPGYLPALDICEQVEEMSPIREYSISITVPEGKPFHYMLANGVETPSVRTEEGNRTVNWYLTDIPAYYPTESDAMLAGNVRVVLAHTYASAADALKVLRSQFTAATDKEVTALAKTLTEGKPEGEREAALKAYVNGLGNCRLDLATTGYRIRSAAEVIRTAYGTDAEKLNLLVGLMKAVGLSAEPKAAYAVKAAPEYLGLSAIRSLFLTSQSIADLQDFQPVLTLGAQPVSMEASKPIDKTETLDITAESGTALAGGYRVVDLPKVSTRIGALNSQYNGNFLLPHKVDETHTTIVRLADGMQFCTQQGYKEISNEAGVVQLTVVVEKGTVKVIRSLKLKNQLIAPADYAAFRRLVMEWEDSSKGVLLVKGK